MSNPATALQPVTISDFFDWPTELEQLPQGGVVKIRSTLLRAGFRGLPALNSTVEEDLDPFFTPMPAPHLQEETDRVCLGHLSPNTQRRYRDLGLFRTVKDQEGSTFLLPTGIARWLVAYNANADLSSPAARRAFYQDFRSVVGHYRRSLFAATPLRVREEQMHKPAVQPRDFTWTRDNRALHDRPKVGWFRRILHWFRLTDRFGETV